MYLLVGDSDYISEAIFFALVSLFLMASQHSWVISCQSYPRRRTVAVVFNLGLRRIRGGLIHFTRVLIRKWTEWHTWFLNSLSVMTQSSSLTTTQTDIIKCDRQRKSLSLYSVSSQDKVNKG